MYKMKMICTFFPLFLLLVSALAFQGVDTARIPEHTCHKLIDSKNCDLQKCIQECSQEPNGVGECKQTICFCTYYCKNPPM
ncbi:S locus-related glycoprotein 1 binding pollen coat [Melia azedarach]|uniref:S locus-related glycoprotein 1 binding pollen coat n=1 Tax=Melia azedarach TaxID=155640 RepID=A0ACC1X4E9_MELAZ|nr:S locus-related glycoprotein 1 binding pollen coat [Melia azedarach]